MNNFVFMLQQELTLNFLHVENFEKEEDIFLTIFSLFKRILDSTIEFGVYERDTRNILLIH